MFHSARLSLTAWYLLIIMCVSFFFSFLIYSSVNSEFRRFEAIDKVVQEHTEAGMPIPRSVFRARIDPELIAAARSRLLTTLGTINLVIFGISGIAGYFLAGRTLKPIQKMVTEQRRFITDASHELRTPLTSLRSELEVGLREKDMSGKEARQLLKSNLEEVIHLQTLSESLLELTQYDKTLRNSTYIVVSLQDVLKEAEKNVQGLAKKKEIMIKSKDRKLQVKGSKDALRELFTILLDNAIKYSNAKSTITIETTAVNRAAVVSIRDEGSGIAEKDLPHIFERFYRADSARSNGGGGFGLGLAIAKQIVDAHSGTITVKSIVSKPARSASQSDAGGGTTFTVQLPRA